MKKLLNSVLLLLLCTTAFAQGGVVYEWAKNIGSSTGNENIRSIKTSASGFVFITGGFQGTCDFDPGAGTTTLAASGSNDIFFAKYTATGTLVWVKKVGSTGDDYGLALELGTNDTIIIAGYFSGAPNLVDFDPNPSSTLGVASAGQSDGFIAKYDSAGNYQWVRRIAGTGFDYTYGLALDASENIFITGSHASPSLNFEDPDATLQFIQVQSSSDAYFAKYDRRGMCVYGKGFSGTGTSDIGRGITVDASGDVYITGQFIGTCDFNADTAAAQVANLTSYNLTNTDAFLTKYSNAGVYQWAQRLGSNSSTAANTDYGFTLTPASNGGVIVGGQYFGVGIFGSLQVTAAGTLVNGFFARYDAAGTCTWVKAIGGTNNEAQVYSLTTDNSGNIFVAGRYKGVVDFDGSVGIYTLTSNPSTANDIFLAKYDTSGSLLWVNSMGSTTSDEAMDVHVDASGNIFMCGYFTGTVDFDPLSGTQNVVSAGSNDGFIAKYSQCNLLPAPVAITGIDSTCSSLSNALYTATPVAGATSYTWTVPGGWTGTSTTNTINISSNLVAGTITVKANNSCGASPTRSKSIFVEVFNVTPFTSVSGPSTVCAGGTATYTASGGSSAPSVYVVWEIPAGASFVGPSNGASVTVQFGNTTGAAAVRAARGRFCDTTAFATGSITVLAAPNGSVSPANPSVCTGSPVTLTASGGTSYAWSNGLGSGATKTVSPTAATTYTVTITQSGNNCPDVDTITVNVNTVPAASISPASLTICSGANATLTAGGGTQYAWSNSGGSNAQATYQPTTTTTYTVTVSDGNNCSATASRLVTVNSLPTAAILPATVIICAGESATLTASGGTQYAWSNSGGSAAQATFAPVNTTMYSVTVTNANNCSVIAQRQVSVNSLPTASITPATVTICNGETATLTASGGTQFAWSNSGGSNAQATFSPTGNTTYTVTVTDANNCSATASRLVTVNSLPNASINPTSASICEGASQSLAASGGTTYAWSNSLGNGANKTVSPTGTTTYTVTVTNANNCSATASSTVSVNLVPNAVINGPTTICSGLPATLTATGGGTYNWSNSLGTNASITVTPTNNTTYTVTVTGTGNCTATASQTVSVQSSPTANIAGPTSVCNGDSITLTANGGNTYTWSNGAASASIKVAPATNTTYNVTVSIGANCTATATQSVTVNAKPTPTVAPTTATICSGQQQTITAGGGTTYAWSNSGGSNAQALFSPTTSTTYTVTVSNTNCSATATATVNVNQTPTASVSPQSSAVCLGSSQLLTATGGGTYNWSNGGGASAGTTFTPANTTTYTVTVTQNNCTATATATVTVNSLPTASVTPATATICAGGSQQLTASGGTTYAWSSSLGSSALQSVSPTTNTTYTVTVTNANNCTATASSTVTVNPLPVAAINGPTTICSGLSATLTASGGGTYNWSNGLGSTAAVTVTPTNATTYTVTVTGTGNCTATASQTVSVQSTPTATITGSTTVCAGESVNLTANGGNTYAWSNSLGASATVTVAPTSATTYTVTASLGVNCSASATHTVTVLQPTNSSFSQTICAGESFTFNGVALTQNGSYNDTTSNSVGCDSVITLNLTVLTPISTTLNEAICSGGTYNFNGTPLTAAGQYFDTLSSINNCDSVVVLNLSITAAPQITQHPAAASPAVCAGTTVSLTVTATGNNLAYAWKEGSTTVGTNSNNYTSSALTSGSKVYTVEVSNTCGIDTSDPVSITVNALPVPTITQSGFNLSTQPYTTYQWKLNGDDVGNATTQTYTATANGTYTVFVTDANGCSAVSQAINVTGVSIDETKADNIQIYPNPATDVLMIETDIPVQTITVYDVSGKVVSSSISTNRISVIELAQGTYTINITTLNGKHFKKVFTKM